MQWLQKAKTLFTYQPTAKEPFILTEGTLPQEMERRITDEEPTKSPVRERSPRQLRKPIPITQKLDPSNTDNDQISYDLGVNRLALERLFHGSINNDLIQREFHFANRGDGLLVYLDGIADNNRIMYAVLQPLMILTERCRHEPDGIPERITADAVSELLLPIHQLEVLHCFADVVKAILDGQSVLFMAGDNQAIAVETRSFPTRSVSPPMVEMIVRGPQEAFTESMRTNIGLVRKYIRNRHLVTEMIDVGENCTVAMLYVQNVASPKLVAEVKKRLQAIQGKFLRETGIIEQMIEDSPGSIYPQVTTTERPDAVATMLQDGRVAILADGSPFPMVMPTTLFTLLKTPEDTYMRPAFGSFMRIIRVIALFISYLLPGTYLAVVNHHPALIPTDLLLAIAGAREGVPFPSWIEVLLMEASFEIIREAGIRVPGVVGPTMGILGAIVLGQAAVQAAIVSPFLIIVVAITALASYAIPNYALQFTTRVIRFPYIVLGYTLGLYGIVIGIAFQLVYTANLTSFGVSYFSPITPHSKLDKGIITRTPVQQYQTRPDYLQVQQRAYKVSSFRQHSERDEQDENT